MVSFKAYFLSWVLWLTRKGIFQSAEALHKQIKAMRQSPDNKPPEHLRKKFIVDERQAGGYTVYEISPKSETPNRARILYLHGGAFVFDATSRHFEFVAQLAERLQASVTLPLYPLGPEHKMADMYAMLQPIHDEMAASRDEAPFFVMGDSAGGTLALVLTQEAIKADKPTAKRLVPITPACDFTFRNPDVFAVAKIDPWLDVPGCEESTRLVEGDWKRDDPRMSPIYGDLSKLPPMLVFVGQNDMLTPDTKLFVEKAREKHREVVLIEGEGLMHVWPVLPIPEAAGAVDKIVAWFEQDI